MLKFLYIFLCIFSLCACAPCYQGGELCPVYPIAGEKVAKELENIPDLTHTFEWLARLNKLRQELQLCAQ